MNDLLKTLTFVVVALALTGAAFVSTNTRPHKGDPRFNDQGQPFFPDFKDPLACTDLEVVSFEPSTATASRFRVMFKNNKWVIPSHYDYPADARDRLSKTSAAVMDLTKDTIRSDRVEDQQAMGVIDPLDAKSTSLEGRGKRVTLRDSSEKVLADFIIGNEVKGATRKEGEAPRYVRVPDQKRTYGVVVKADLSTKFADWIETNLLKLETSKIRRVVFDNYRLVEDRDAQGSFMRPAHGDRITIERKDSTGPWSQVTVERPNEKGNRTASGIPSGQELNEDKLRTLTDALGDLKIVGVRPKPPGFKDPNDPGRELLSQIKLLESNPNALPSERREQIATLNQAIIGLRNKGFYLLRDGLYSDQGDVIVTTEEGVVYTLRYGGPVFATGDELTAGSPDTAKKDETKKLKEKDAAKKPEGTQENRFLMVRVEFDPTIIAKPVKEAPKPLDPSVIPDEPFAPDPNDPKYQAEQKTAEDKAKRDQADYDKKIADGQKRVKELTDRFGPWYYVTSGESFNQINLDFAVIFKPKGPAAGAAPPAGIPLNPSFPQDHP
jgi:hypothetical protein